MKESIPKEHLLLVEEIIQMIVVMTIGCSEVKDILMKEEDHQRKEGIPMTETEDPPRRGGLHNNGRPLR